MNILFVNIPILSHIIPSLDIVEKLVSNGHKVDYINSNHFKELIEDTGANLIPYLKVPNALSNVDLWMYKISYDTAVKIGCNYDIIIYEMADFIGESIGEYLKKPTVRICSQFALNDNIKNKLLYSNSKYIPFRYKKSAKFWTKLFLSLNVKFRYNDYYDEITNNASKLNIILTSKKFQYFGETFNSNYKFVGPCISNKYKTTNSIKKNNKNQLIYISAGTISSSKSFIKKCVKAFANTKYNVIISTGERNKKNKYTKKFFPNIKIVNWVSQYEILSKASLFISHAGMNSVNEALYFGVPLIISPITNDQFIIADRIEELNIGKRINIKEISPSSLFDLSNEILNDQNILHNTNDIMKNMRNSGGSDIAVNLIENYYNKIKNIEE